MIASVAHLVAWSMMKLMGERSLPTVLGALAGLQTQPAALSFAADRVSPEKVQVGYASVYPLATIGKIILAQLLLGLH
jgi:putative transport protein